MNSVINVENKAENLKNMHQAKKNSGVQQADTMSGTILEHGPL